MQYLYDPEGPLLTRDKSVSSIITELQDLSVKVLLHALHNALGREVITTLLCRLSTEISAHTPVSHST